MKTHIKTLNIDLSTREIHINEQSAKDLTLEEKLGGFGKAVHDIGKHIEEYPDLKDAYDPNNLLGFYVGALVGGENLENGRKLMTARRTIVAGLSPLKTSKAGT